MESQKPHAALLSSPGMGHLIPIIELGKRLVTHHEFKVTIFAVTTETSVAESLVLQSATDAPNLLDIVELPAVDISSLVEPKDKFVTRLAVMMREARPGFRNALLGMKDPPSVLIVDLFGYEILPVADEFEIPKYVFVASEAWFFSLLVYSPILDELVHGEYVDQKQTLQIPGCKPVRPEDVVDPMLDRTDRQYREYLIQARGMAKGDGILLNTWEDLDPTSLAALREDKILSRVVKVPVYPIGPLVRPIGPLGSRSEIFDWLDKQPVESVIFVSFGSGGTLSANQITELAWGLELSRVRFIWVVRQPMEDDACGSFFSSGNGSDDASWYLPQGFLSRTHKVGLVVPNWAPQREILGHPSIGGFLSHCGWNSTLESITNGVPMIAWPLYAEQRQNATMLSEDLEVAVRPKVLPTKKVVGREEIENMVKMIMEKEGHILRERTKELKCSGEKALSKGGSSYESLLKVAKECQKSLQLQKEKKGKKIELMHLGCQR